MITAREALDRATECAERGDIARGTLWLGIAREVREDAWMRASSGGVKLEAAEPAEAREDSWLAANTRTLPGGTAYDRVETEVIRRTPGETTPAYDAAGETLGNTVSIPITIAHPQSESRGPNSTCVNCGEDVFWERGRGWLHDQSGSARCTGVAS